HGTKHHERWLGPHVNGTRRIGEDTMNINRNAPIVAAHEIAIGADIQTVWRALTSVDRWPDWNADIQRAQLTGLLAAGTVFNWETAGFAISSTIADLTPSER